MLLFSFDDDYDDGSASFCIWVGVFVGSINDYSVSCLFTSLVCFYSLLGFPSRPSLTIPHLDDTIPMIPLFDLSDIFCLYFHSNYLWR